VNVVVTEHQTQFRAGLARLLAAETRLKVVSQSGDAYESGEVAIQPLPDYVGSDTEPARVQILVFAADFGGAADGAADENGGTHFGRNFTAEGIIARLLALYSSGTAVVTNSPPEVSKRELVVLAQVAAGLSNKQIGGLLGISQKTVRNHLSRIFSKLGAGNRTQAVMKAMRLGLLNV
jgi:DNA-binding NarL/FixJ family response regulator